MHCVQISEKFARLWMHFLRTNSRSQMTCSWSFAYEKNQEATQRKYASTSIEFLNLTGP